MVMLDVQTCGTKNPMVLWGREGGCVALARGRRFIHSEEVLV